MVWVPIQAIYNNGIPSRDKKAYFRALPKSEGGRGGGREFRAERPVQICGAFSTYCYFIELVNFYSKVKILLR